MMPDFIKTHLITKIKEQVKEKQEILQFDGFLFLDKDIIDEKKINRLNKWSIYPKEELLPLNWYHIKGSNLLEVYSQLKDNNFYIYKLISGKSHKMRIKKRK
jgi:hypothetical protein